jgi:hypothetical protein
MGADARTIVGITGVVFLILVGFTLAIGRWRYAIHRSREIRKRKNSSAAQSERERRERRRLEAGIFQFECGANCLAERLARAEIFMHGSATVTTARDTRFKDGPDLEALPVYSDADEPPVYGEYTGTRLVTPPPVVHVRH